MPPGRLLNEKLPLFALAAVIGLVTFRRSWAESEIGLDARMPLGMRMANALVSYVGHIGKMLWPTGLAVWYPMHGVVGGGSGGSGRWAGWGNGGGDLGGAA